MHNYYLISIFIESLKSILDLIFSQTILLKKTAKKIIVILYKKFFYFHKNCKF